MKKLVKNVLFFGSLVSMTACGQTPTSTSVKNSEVASEETSIVPSEIETPSPSPVEYEHAQYQNPVDVAYQNGRVYAKEVADPSVVYDPETQMFYCFSTDRRLFSSFDGCEFELVSESIVEMPTWGDELVDNSTALCVWAPDVVNIDGTWIYFYSLSGWGLPVGIGCAISTDGITGPYYDYGKIFTCEEIGVANAIDPQVFQDDDGSIYMTFGSFQGIYIVELSDDGLSLSDGLQYQMENKVLLSGPDDTSEWDSQSFEGSYIIKKDDYYYYFGSTGSCCNNETSTYRVMCGRSKNIFGPYLDSTGHDIKNDDGERHGHMVVDAHQGTAIRENCAGVGHNSIVKDFEGNYWIYYHGYSKHDRFSTRHLFMDKLEWVNGFPQVKNQIPSYDEILEGPAY